MTVLKKRKLTKGSRIRCLCEFQSSTVLVSLRCGPPLLPSPIPTSPFAGADVEVAVGGVREEFAPGVEKGGEGLADG